MLRFCRGFQNDSPQIYSKGWWYNTERISAAANCRAEFSAGLTHTEVKLIKCGFQLQDYNINSYRNIESQSQRYYSKQGKTMFVLVCELVMNQFIMNSSITEINSLLRKVKHPFPKLRFCIK